MLTAPHGGNGGRTIESGMCVEEPDIEIGAGVSSKAISRRMQTDKGGNNGPKSTRHREDDQPQWQQGHDDNNNQRNTRAEYPNNQQSMSSTNFPFGIGTLPNGMPNFPAGFAFPDPSSRL